jgi:hypothetical protein
MPKQRECIFETIYVYAPGIKCYFFSCHVNSYCRQLKMRECTKVVNQLLLARMNYATRLRLVTQNHPHE